MLGDAKFNMTSAH